MRQKPKVGQNYAFNILWNELLWFESLHIFEGYIKSNLRNFGLVSVNKSKASPSVFITYWTIRKKVSREGVKIPADLFCPQGDRSEEIWALLWYAQLRLAARVFFSVVSLAFVGRRDLWFCEWPIAQVHTVKKMRLLCHKEILSFFFLWFTSFPQIFLS